MITQFLFCILITQISEPPPAAATSPKKESPTIVDVSSSAGAEMAAVSSPIKDAPLVSLPSTSCSKDDSFLLCLEEASYPDDSSDDSIEEALPESQPQQSLIDADSSFAQYCGYVPSCNSHMLFSPNSAPWLGPSSSQHIFASSSAGFSPPLAPQVPQAPKLHHLSPPSSIPVMYNFVPMYNFEENGEFQVIFSSD